MSRADDRWVLWGSELSPYALKLEALLRFHGVPYRWLPVSARFPEAQRAALRRARLVAGRQPLTWPRKTELDEFPMVPFLFGPGGENLYDSSAIAEWLDRLDRGWLDREWLDREGGSGAGFGGRARAASLIPDADPALRFAVRLVDEALDEVGLYLVHHNRWVVAARDTDAGARLAREVRPLLGPAATLLAHRFPARQVRRLPYLFSVADPEDEAFADLPRHLRPPARAGFPPTHALLEQAFAELLAAVEPVLDARPFLFGERFCLADASLYGQLGIHRCDPSARAWIARDAPATQAWIERIARGDLDGAAPGGALALDAALAPLLAWVGRSFVPLMRANSAAWERARASGETRFNEAAFDAGRALYDGELLGRPFRSVVKTFQVQVWRDLLGAWGALDESERARVDALGAAVGRATRDLD